MRTCKALRRARECEQGTANLVPRIKRRAHEAVRGLRSHFRVNGSDEVAGGQ